MDDQIVRLLRLEEDWDSCGARKIREQSVCALLRLWVTLRVGEYQAVPTSKGGCQLELHEQGFSIEIEISPDGKTVSADIAVNSPSEASIARNPQPVTRMSGASEHG